MSNDKRTENWYRRRLLKSAGVAGAVGLAGCAGDGDETTEGNGNGGGNGNGNGGGNGNGNGGGNGNGNGGGNGNGMGDGGTPKEDAFTSGLVFQLVPEMNWNRFAGTINFPFFGRVLEYVPLALWDKNGNNHVPIAASGWEFDGATMTIELNDWFEYTNGEPLTAEDVVADFRLENLVGRTPFNRQINDIQQTGEYTIELGLENPDLNSDILLFDLLGTADFRTKPGLTATPISEYQEFIDRLDDATSDDARSQIQADLTNMRLDEPVGCGPYHFNIDESQNELAVFDRRDDYGDDGYPLDKIQSQINDEIGYDFSNFPSQYNHPKYELLFYEEKRAELMINDQQDANVAQDNVTDQLLNQIPDHMVLTGIESFSGSALMPQHNDELFGDRAFRKAIAHILPQRNMSRIKSGKFGQEIQNQTGLTNAMESIWLGDEQEFLDSLDQYSTDSDPESARAVLEDAGYSEQNNEWVTPDGETVSFTVVGPPRHSEDMLGASEAMNAFNLNSEVQSIETSALADRRLNGDFQLMSDFYGGGPHIYINANVNYTSQEAREAYEYPAEVTVPAMDGSGDMTVNVRELTDKLGTNIPEDELVETTKTLAWVWNQDFPLIETSNNLGSMFHTEDNWQWPEYELDGFRMTGDTWMSHGYYWWRNFHTGAYAAITE